MESVQEQIRIFSRSRSLKSTDISEYTEELSKYIKELEILQNRIKHRHALLSDSYDRISTIRSSKDPNMLQSVLRSKIALLQERKNRLYREISDVKSSLSTQKNSLLLLTHPTLPSSHAAECTARLMATQHRLNQSILNHYTRYNTALSEIEEIAKDSSITKEDRTVIFSVLFPLHKKDPYPFLTKVCRKIFGTRVSTGIDSVKEILRRAKCSELHISSRMDAFEGLACFIHFIQNHLLISSSFVFGVVCMVSIILWKLLYLMSSLSSTLLVISSISVISCFLFNWAFATMLMCFFPYVLGRGLIHHMTSSHFLSNDFTLPYSLTSTPYDDTSNLDNTTHSTHSTHNTHSTHSTSITDSSLIRHNLSKEIESLISCDSSFYPLFVANSVASIVFCMFAISLIDLLLSVFIPKYSRCAFMMVCVFFSSFSGIVSTARSFESFKHSPAGSPLRIFYFSFFVVSGALSLFAISIGSYAIAHPVSYI